MQPQARASGLRERKGSPSFSLLTRTSKFSPSTRKSIQVAAQHRYRSRRQGIHRGSAGIQACLRRRLIRIGVSIFSRRMPLILLPSKADTVNRTRKSVLTLVIVVLKYNSDGVGIVMVFVDKQQRPLLIRPLQCVGSDERVALPVLYIARCQKLFVSGISRFSPLLRKQLSRVKLRSPLPDSIILVDHEHVIRSPAVGAGRMRR